MEYHGKERRQFERYDMEAKINFSVGYDLETKVEFRVLLEGQKGSGTEKWAGLSKNFSAEGMRFTSDKKLTVGDNLFIEVYLPKHEKPIPMTGQVRWSGDVTSASDGEQGFDTGVKLINLKDQPIAKTIHYDKKYQVAWSIVLDAIFGDFQKFIREEFKKRDGNKGI